MARKKTINLAVPEDLLDQFNVVCSHYGHAKQKGLVLSAAMLMFLRADPQDQGRCLEDLVRSDIADGVKRVIANADREQQLRAATQEALSSPLASKAAKARRPDAKRPIKRKKSP